ncbi:non-ribosomal peptide synthetase [Staphylococcus equorum]|uniref:non-ribosomal peptide synthetase n=1 Tax=Staphylococcus equorum TaxID=246432 RepID=UPI000E67C012|nr:non-ribosomal peptide synthetase [Staphylococcus equorum]RIL47326.1 amino acid adenylation domain-containing protein [Staphylococcus equorum]
METINLSDAQTEIIQLQEYYENNSINNISVIIYIKPGIKIEEIEKALNNLIKTHETYRIKLKKVKSEYKQYISEHKDKKFDFVDFKNNQVGYTKWINEQARKNLFSTDSDLFDFKIVKLPTGKIGIFLMEHHVISDAWSITVAANTISKYLNDGPNSKEIESTYFDYIEEEIEYKNTKRFEKDKSFWLKKTENLEDNELFEKNSDNNGHSNRKSYSLSDIETHRIHEFCEKNNISINNLFSAMMIIIKYKKTASKKISVGSIMHNRNKKAEKGVTGVFSRALPIIIDVSSDYSISDLLTQTKYETFNILKHRKYPYRNIVEDSGGQKGLLDCLISYQNTQYSHEVLKNVYSDEWIENGSNNAPLTVNISNRNRKNTLTVDYDYQTAIVNEKEIIDLHNIILKIMDKAIENPNTKIKNIEILDENEKYTILNEFNDTEASLNNKETFVERFEKQVKATPYQTAITYEGESLNYDELNARANQLAYQLRAEGVGANSLIALIMDRQLETIIGIYGILKAGGAYVPIDPKYPIDRINYILEDSQPKVLLTDRELDEAINYGNKVIDLTETTRLEAFPTSNLKQISDESNLMYVIYTSGTTGKPKGVMAHSEGVMNRLNWVINKYNVDGEDTILFKTPYTFDVSVWEIFGWAMLGSQIVLLPSGEEGNPEKITELLEGYSVAMVHFVPSMLNMFVNFIKSTNNAQAISKLKYVLASGEALKPEQVNDFNHFIGNKNNTALLNLYGPTETTVDVTSFDCENHKTYDSIPIGKPISNIQDYILNEDNNIMGIGVTGEICIAGVGVTAGYLNRPELTQEKFLDNPFGKGKLYRTGDLAKWNGDGNIIYIGRIDEQVKIRGYRIELGEIESILRQHTHINDVAIVARPMVDNELSICAYLVSDDSLDFGSLKTSLGQKLPDYMIPAYMTQLDELPVTSNGKLNKKALPEIKVESKVYVAPTNDMESAVAETFEAVLHVDQVSIHDNFFEMGGHSLKAISVINEIEHYIGIRLPLKIIFEKPTVAQLAEFIKNSEDHTNIQDIPQAEDKSAYYVSSQQKRLYVLNEMTEGQTAYNMPGIFEIKGEVDIERVRFAFQSLINHHEILRTRFEVFEGEPVQIIEDSVSINIDYEEEMEVNDDTLLSEFVSPFDLAQAPLLRVKVVKSDEQKYLLLFDMHHIISDGLSINIIIKDFSRLYQNQALEELKIRYRDYSEWMRERDLSQQRSFWLSQFEKEAPVLDLPYDYPRLKQQSFKGRTMSMHMPNETKKAIHQLAQTTGSTDYMILSASFMVLLHKYSRQEDIVIGSPVSGRTHKDTEDILGMFVNTLAMRSYPERDKSFEQLLSEVKNLSIKAFDNQEYPLEDLVEEVVERSDLSRNPLFDVLFALQNNDNQAFEINDWSVEIKEASHTNAKFDLSMTIEENEGYKVSLEYASELFSKATIERMLKHFMEILVEITKDPSQKMTEIEMITKEEKAVIFDKFNDTEASLNNKETFVERFEKQVKATPYQTAITYEGESLNYDELNARANQLAYQLRAEGVGANSLIALIMDRQLETIIGIYGILKAGGAYVPIDPKYPIDRINYILEDSQPKVLLTDRELDEAINYGNKVIDLTETTRLEAFPTSNLKQISDESNLMYVIYTSGTTGKPKGVMAHSEGVMNRLNWVINKYNVDGEDTILFKTPYTFDVSVWEIFGWAMLGSQIVLLPSGEEGNPEKITELLEGYSVAMVHFVPSMLNMFVNFIKSTNNAQAISKLKYVLASGEALKPEQVNDFNHFIGNKNNTALLNLYGPTETTVDVTSFDCENHKTYDSIPIGKPISNIQAYILNEDNNIMGIGVPGELCIAGVGVTAGYLNRPELTQEKFIDNPFGKGKLYRTGDLAKWNGDGNIIYIGRIDEQVKIRGYRIELGEIESILRQHTHINDVAIVARPMVDNELSICAYLVSDDSLDFGSLKTSLGQKLPDYMIPAYMTQLDELPVTSNGKLNKKALPEIKVESKVYVAPTNDMESAVAKTFEAVLHVDQISIHDNFFEMGGDSLKAIKLTSLISKSYNISIKDIFELQTIASISKALVEREEMNVMTKLDALKIPNVKNEHHFNSDFISEINDYKVKSNENYKFIDKDVVKSDKQILLTGATGYLGIHILKDLLERKDLIIYVLVRNSEKISGENKLNNNWFYYFNSQLKTEDLSRIHFVEGDIESKYLGFSNSNYDYLVNNIDIIINAAANVNHFATEESSYNTNVKSIHNLISFAKDKNKKEIHHMSTISIASGSIEDKDSSTFSEYDVDISQKPNNIYIDSKIEAEKLLIAYREEGIETNIYRLGNLQCDSRTGIFQKNEENNAFYSVIKSFKMLQKFPRLEEDDLEFTHVDQAAKACNKLILNDQLSNEIHHIYNNKRLSLQKLMAVYNENNHYIEAVYWDAFLDHLMECINLGVMSDEVNAFLLHTGILDNTLFNKAHFEILDYKTNFILEKLNFQWEPTSENTLNIMINHTKNNF